MAKMYENRSTHTFTFTGVISSIEDNRCDYTVKTAEYNRDEGKNEEKEVKVIGENPLAEGVSVGDKITVLGEFSNRKGGYEVIHATTKDESYDFQSICVIRGEVMFANYNEEKNADGTPKMAKAFGDKPEHEKKPHFDIGVVTNDPDPSSSNGETKRVLHTIKVYAGKDPKPLDRVQAAFKNFSKENPCTVSFVTAPGEAVTKERDVNGKKYVNTYVTHMGYRFMDIEWGREKTKSQPAAAAEKKEDTKAPLSEAPAKDESAPAQSGSGFEAPEEAPDIAEGVGELFV